MDKPCKHCEKALSELAEERFEQECYGTCEKYEIYADGLSKGLDVLIAEGEKILNRHKH